MPFLKLVFTAIALGTGFVGGEVAPLFVMGSTLGAAIAPACTASPAARHHRVRGSIRQRCPVDHRLVLTVEQFGWHTFVPALIVCGVARVVAGRPGLYIAH